MWWQVTDTSRKLQMRLNWTAPSFGLLIGAISGVLCSSLCVYLVNNHWLHWWSPKAPDEAAGESNPTDDPAAACAKWKAFYSKCNRSFYFSVEKNRCLYFKGDWRHFVIWEKAYSCFASTRSAVAVRQARFLQRPPCLLLVVVKSPYRWCSCLDGNKGSSLVPIAVII